jgi:hypothetical protein
MQHCSLTGTPLMPTCPCPLQYCILDGRGLEAGSAPAGADLARLTLLHNQQAGGVVAASVRGYQTAGGSASCCPALW